MGLAGLQAAEVLALRWLWALPPPLQACIAAWGGAGRPHFTSSAALPQNTIEHSVLKILAH